MRRPWPPLAALLLLPPEAARTDSPTQTASDVAVGAESFVAALAGVRLPVDGSPAAVYSVEGGGMLTRLWVTNADERVWMQGRKGATESPMHPLCRPNLTLIWIDLVEVPF